MHKRHSSATESNLFKVLPRIANLPSVVTKPFNTVRDAILGFKPESSQRRRRTLVSGIMDSTLWVPDYRFIGQEMLPAPGQRQHAATRRSLSNRGGGNCGNGDGRCRRDAGPGA